MMADIFASKEVQALLKNKNVVLLGDSNTRATYKDLICLYQKNIIIPQQVLKNKMEQSVYDDELVTHGKLYKGRDYVEHRKLTSDNCKISFYFITRVYNDYVGKILKSFQEKGSPDVVIMNSCLWDICRWGPRGVEEYKQNIKTLMGKFNKILGEKCLVIWVTTPPVSQEMKGGFLVDQLEFLKYSLRFHILEANTYARRVVVAHGYDVVDTHYHLQMQLTKRAEDGIHWVPLAVRHVTNLLLTHIALAWGFPLPHRIDTLPQEKMSAADFQNDEAGEINQPNHEQDAASEGHEVFALKEIGNEQASFVQKSKKKTKQKHKNNNFDETHRGFEARKRQQQAHRKIRQWGREPYLLSTPPSFSPPESRALLHPPLLHPSHYSPYNPHVPRPPFEPYNPHVPQYPFEANYYLHYSENSPAPYVFPDPARMQPNFNWTEMRQIQFGRGPSRWHPR